MPVIQLDPNNANRGTDRGRRLVRQSLSTSGAGRGVVVDRDGTLIAGNKTYAEWEKMGGKIEIMDTDGNTLVVTRRVDLDLNSSDPEVRERSRLLAYYDNQSSFQGLSWDPAAFKADIASGLDLTQVFEEDELEIILGDTLDEEEADDESDFGSFSSESSGDYVKFKFGDYAGQVERVVYESFLALYKRTQEGAGAAILSDVLAAMFASLEVEHERE